MSKRARVIRIAIAALCLLVIAIGSILIPILDPDQGPAIAFLADIAIGLILAVDIFPVILEMPKE